MPYILTLIVLIFCYFIVLLNMRFMKNTKLFNIIFILIVSICYIYLVVFLYNDVGRKDWNFLNTLPVANVSPFMFTLTPFCLIMPKKIRKHFFVLISLLSVGMFLSPLFNCIRNAVISYKFHPHFLLDYVAHFALSLFGIYLVKSKQIEINFKSFLISSSTILIAAFSMLILNIIFDTSFFGLSLNGKHNIYNAVIVSNSYLSAIIYFAGLICVLILGYVLQNINKKSKTY